MAGFVFAINSMTTALQQVFDWFFGILSSAGIPIMMLISSIVIWMFVSRFSGAFIGSDARLGRFMQGTYSNSDTVTTTSTHTQSPQGDSFTYRGGSSSSTWTQ